MVAGQYSMDMSRIRSQWKIAGIRLDVYRIEGDTDLPTIASERARGNPRTVTRFSP